MQTAGRRADLFIKYNTCYLLHMIQDMVKYDIIKYLALSEFLDLNRSIFDDITVSANCCLLNVKSALYSIFELTR